MALQRMDSLRDKLEQRAVINEELKKMDDKIDEITNPKKSKIKSKSKKLK